MNIIQLVLMAVGVLSLLGIGYVLLSGPDAGKYTLSHVSCCYM